MDKNNWWAKATGEISEFFGGTSNYKEGLRSDAMAALTASNYEKQALKDQYDAESRWKNSLAEQQQSLGLASEASQSATQLLARGNQQASQIRTAGTLTAGQQTAMLAATGQTGAGSATGLVSQTNRNTAADASQAISNAQGDADIYSTKAAGYTSLAATQEQQAGLDLDYLNKIDPKKVKQDYMDAYNAGDSQSVFSVRPSASTPTPGFPGLPAPSPTFPQTDYMRTLRRGR